MGVYEMTGTNRGGEYGRVCIVRAASSDEAFKTARAIYGSGCVTGSQAYNDMCDDCALLGQGCEGSHSQVWTGCVRRKEREDKLLSPGDRIWVRGKTYGVSVIQAQDYYKGVWDAEFLDENGQYHHWKSDYDGGRVFPGPEVIYEG
ncbi:MAG: hypothetical protein IJ153_05605 [Clostridia bacterium]|nr:hypothetical protein [Clostridia bacterium]MBQ9211160.1 hypothetical protein [Clostridia bacterium]